MKIRSSVCSLREALEDCLAGRGFRTPQSAALRLPSLAPGTSAFTLRNATITLATIHVSCATFPPACLVRFLDVLCQALSLMCLAPECACYVASVV
ncbi:hypothetical protein E2C01_043163 [Portunus trituberculatus]|uniref:Uncharacterized protein n=1 Tax=Portunus trituberculatus TaxID=210409 RepID=A0A5B7FYT2_PORTR|nr:hypothetical protein [Portunus trituberculatus]